MPEKEIVTPHPDEQAREWLMGRGFPKPDSLSFQRDIAGLSALLARVRQQALEEAAQACESGNTGAFMEANIRKAFADRIRSLRQAAGERTKP